MSAGDAGASISIRHDEAAHRFATRVDGVEGFVEYEPSQRTLVLTHTIVPEAIGGRGIAGKLVQAVYDHARDHGLKVLPRCSYAVSWIQRHPEYADVAA